jgi:5-carboxyvanillate decarboxylase
MKRIAIEEAFVTRGVMVAWRQLLDTGAVEDGFRLMGESILADTPINAPLHQRLLDVGPGRIAQMDRDGIDMAVLSLTSPGVQVFNADLATALAAEANDELAAAVRAHPQRFAGLAAVAPQDPQRAAREIERARRELGLVGLIINSHTHGEYLDHDKFQPLLITAEYERMPLYLHPREPGPGLLGPHKDYGLYFATWGFAVETSLHAMRLIMSGTFDRFPKLKVILGHMGEGLPFWLQRIDNRYQLQVRIGAVKPLKRLPSEYFLDNFVITTAGVTSQPALRLALDVLGPDRVLFAADYPYEDAAAAVRFIEEAEINTATRALLFEHNATALFGLPTTA